MQPTSSIRFWSTGLLSGLFRSVSSSLLRVTANRTMSALRYLSRKEPLSLPELNPPDHHQRRHRGSSPGCPSSLARMPIPRSPRSARWSPRTTSLPPSPTALPLQMSPPGSAYPGQHRPSTGPSCSRPGCTSDAGLRADEHP